MTEKSARHGGDVFGLSAAEQEKVLDFSININPLGLSPLGKEALLHSWEREALRYPDVECRGLLAAISTRYGVPTDTIALGNGATELMYKLLSLLKPLKVLVPAPSFSEYRLSAEAAGCEVESFLLPKENGFRLPLEEIRRKMTAHSLLYLGHPNNPDNFCMRMISARSWRWQRRRMLSSSSMSRSSISHPKGFLIEMNWSDLPTARRSCL